MNPPKDRSEHAEHHATARAMARTCYRDAVEFAVQTIKDKKAKPRDRVIAALVIVIASEWPEE